MNEIPITAIRAMVWRRLNRDGKSTRDKRYKAEEKRLQFLVVGKPNDEGMGKKLMEIIYWKVDESWNVYGWIYLNYDEIE